MTFFEEALGSLRGIWGLTFGRKAALGDFNLTLAGLAGALAAYLGVHVALVMLNIIIVPGQEDVALWPSTIALILGVAAVSAASYLGLGLFQRRDVLVDLLVIQLWAAVWFSLVLFLIGFIVSTMANLTGADPASAAMGILIFSLPLLIGALIMAANAVRFLTGLSIGKTIAFLIVASLISAVIQYLVVETILSLMGVY